MSYSNTQLSFLAAGYYQLQTMYDDVLAQLRHLELGNSQLRAANAQMHAEKSSFRQLGALNLYPICDFRCSV